MQTGEKLEGDVVEDTGYVLNVNEPTTCVQLCERALDAKDVLHFRGAIADQYTVQMTIDGLPAAMREEVTMLEDETGAEIATEDAYFTRGWPVGFIAQDGKYYLNNHLRIQVSCTGIISLLVNCFTHSISRMRGCSACLDVRWCHAHTDPVTSMMYASYCVVFASSCVASGGNQPAGRQRVPCRWVPSRALLVPAFSGAGSCVCRRPHTRERSCQHAEH